MEWNKLGGQDLAGLEGLYELMMNNRTVTHLDLRNNRITSAGSGILANIIRNNNVLCSMDLRWNELGNSGARALVAALQDNYTIISLDLSGNSVNEDILNEIEAICRANRNKTH